MTEVSKWADFFQVWNVRFPMRTCGIHVSGGRFGNEKSLGNIHHGTGVHHGRLQ